ncbi:LPS O-antigen chain length determinant protein WzzB [Lonepinella sp. BR2904]|uniref:LPS O-antigen chain length determinant protein WzzB n=1 Tax=Lonepinella sp. BR2904 TaxID=3434551 RepID=UPI003F6E4056
MNDLNRNDNEIDLIELFRALWDKKLWIILSTLVFTLIAGIYAFTAKEQWKSKAEVVSPNVLDLSEYFVLRREYARILGEDFDVNVLSSGLYGHFIQRIYSVDERVDFLKDSTLFQQVSENENEVEKVRTLYRLATEDIAIIKPDEKKNPDLMGNQISLTAENPALAQTTLAQMMTAISQKVLQSELADFTIWFNQTLEALNFEKEKIEFDLKTQESVQLERLNKAYDTASKAGVREYSRFGNYATTGSTQNIVVGDTNIPYQFMLGEKYLKAQIDAEQEKGIIYPERYYEIQRQLTQLEPLVEKLKTTKAQTFHYVSSPDYPVKKDAPKRALILLIGALLGGILGCLLVLVRKVFAK